MARRQPIQTGKSIKIDIPNPKKVKPQWELICDTKNLRKDRLIEVYKENPKHARILFNQATKNEFIHLTCIKYTYENGDINYVTFEKHIGVSVTNRMYSSEKNVRSIIYKKETNKWYYKEGSAIRLLDMGYVSNYFQFLYGYSDKLNNVGYDDIKKHLPWLRNLEEDKWILSHSLNFNTIISHKLYNLKAIYRHMFKVPYPVIELMMTHKAYGGNNVMFFFKMWPQIKKVLINVESLTSELFTHHMFLDTCKMASSVGEKINCSWGVKRFIEMHDKWSKEITNVLLLNQKKTPMKIHKVYEEFAKYSKLRILLTNYDMIEDGMVMHHCVATYINKVNQGKCGIFKIEGHTMEILKDSTQKLHWGQIRGVRNADAPNGVKQLAQDLLDGFNRDILPTLKFDTETENGIIHATSDYEIWGNVDLPF